MPISAADDWSDSDEDISTGIETDVLLGVPDGRVETDADTRDAAVSRIGGLPICCLSYLKAFLPSREPPFSSSQCRVCSDPMELLLQVWCPFAESPMDRALYVWGCARSTCQGQAGSIRAWRGLRYNAVYAAKLKKRQAQKTRQQKTDTSPPHYPAPAVNPFSMKTTAEPTTFGLGDHIFNSPATGISHSTGQDVDDSSDVEDSSSEDSLITAMASTRVVESIWTAAPSYPAIYLSTVSEYIPQPPKAKATASVREEDPVAADSQTGKDATWALEAYENSLEMDNVFDRFTKRVGFTGEQCLRYELKGTPLPFASDKVYEELFPAAKRGQLPVTKAEFKVVPPAKRSYSAASIPSCACCRSRRVFECQLMPNLINVLREAVGDKRADVRSMTDGERMKAVQDALKRKKAAGGRGMEWGTCMIFCCEKDCCVDDGGEADGECWREEYVVVQWDE